MNTIITAILGCASGVLAGILAYIKFFTERKDSKQARSFEAILDDKLKPIITNQQEIIENNKRQDEEIKEIRLDTTRTQLLMLIQQNPHNHDTILKLAHRYFCNLKGNWYMAIEFQRWADEEGIRIPASITTAIANNEK